MLKGSLNVKSSATLVLAYYFVEEIASIYTRCHGLVLVEDSRGRSSTWSTLGTYNLVGEIPCNLADELLELNMVKHAQNHNVMTLVTVC